MSYESLRHTDDRAGMNRASIIYTVGKNYIDGYVVIHCNTNIHIHWISQVDALMLFITSTVYNKT